VNNLKIFEHRWRFDFELHDKVYVVAEALLNINRRVRRAEDLGISSVLDDSPLLAYDPMQADDNQ